MTKTKYIKILFLILICLCLLSSCSSPGWVTDKTEIIIGESEKFRREEIEQAIEVVKKEENGIYDATLLSVRYDENRAELFVGNYMNSQNIIVLLSDFKTYRGHVLQESYAEYTDYKWVLNRRDENSEWVLYEEGYG